MASHGAELARDAPTVGMGGSSSLGKNRRWGKQVIKYNAAYLMGKTRIDHAAFRGETLRMQLEYEF